MSSVATIPTPSGPFTVIVDADGAVLASGWTSDVNLLLPLIASSLRPTSLRDRRDVGVASAAVHAWLDGDLGAPGGVAVRQQGGPFLELAWASLRRVPPGAPVNYTQLAAAAGRPAAVRAAASACARNAAALFVPCHRVLRSDGSLGGFRWGLPTKQWSLTHESASCNDPSLTLR